MPRSIIDTESSRPQYIRRLVVTWIVAALVIAVLLVLFFAVYGRFRQPQHVRAVPTAAVQPLLSSPGPGK